jgi:anti-sigma factor RsiW
MAHLGDRITDYVFGEMTTQEFSAAQEHLRECSDCAGQVEELRRTRNLLQAVPDVEPPRPIIFEVERKAAWKPWLWKWAAPAAAAVAASVLTAVLMSPTQAQFAAELEKRDQAHQMDLERVRSEIAYWERQQRAVSRESLDTARAVQLLADRYRSKTDGD